MLFFIKIMKYIYSLLLLIILSISVLHAQEEVKSKNDTAIAAVYPVREAQFPGGMTAMMAFIGSNIRLPEEAQKADISGVVYVQFKVDKKGVIYDPEIMRGLGFGCDKEVLRLVQMMPQWEPRYVLKNADEKPQEAKDFSRKYIEYYDTAESTFALPVRF
jgi:hypothetical protein